MQTVEVRFTQTFTSGERRGTTQTAYKTVDEHQAAAFQRYAEDGDEVCGLPGGPCYLSDFEVLSRVGARERAAHA